MADKQRIYAPTRRINDSLHLQFGISISITR